MALPVALAAAPCAARLGGAARGRGAARRSRACSARASARVPERSAAAAQPPAPSTPAVAQPAAERRPTPSLPLLAAALLLAAAAAEPAAAAALVASAPDAPHAAPPQLWSVADAEPDFWVNMSRYARFTLTTALGMGYSVAKPMYDLLRKPKTAIPLVLGIAGLTKLIGWTLNAMLGLDPSVDF